MPGKNDIEESDGEGDVSERSANSSDTDDDSEMDVVECEKRRAECMDNLSKYLEMRIRNQKMSNTTTIYPPHS